MKKHTVLLRTYQELDNGISPDVPLDLLKDRFIRRYVSSQDFDSLLQTALEEGDLAHTTPGMIGVTQAGMQTYVSTLQLR